MRKLKLFSLALMALFTTSTWAAKETATNTGTKDADLVGTCYTIDGTYIAGTGSTKTDPMANKGVKVRTNRAATTDGTKSNVIEFKVNENYKITAISLCGNSNTKNKAITLGSVYVDGAEYTGTVETGSIVASNSSGSDKVTTLTDIEATSAIIFTIEDLNSTSQANIYYEITYEQLVECDDPEIAWATAPAASGQVGAPDDVATVTTTPAEHAVTWTSSVTNVATVSNGTIHYVGAGLTTITASLTYTGDDYCKKTVSVSQDVLVPISYDTPGELDKVWYYQSAVPSSSPDNGLSYGSTKSGKGLYGIKLNSSGYAWFAKPEGAGAGTLRIGAYSTDVTVAYEVYAYACNNSGEKSGDALGTLTTDYAGGVSNTINIPAEVTGIRLERKTSNEGTLYFVEFRGEAPCAAGEPGDITKGTLSSGTLTLNAAGSAKTGDTWYWQTAEDGTSKANSGSSFDVTVAGTYYVRSYNTAGDCWSDAKSFVVTAADLVDNYTVVYKDGETTLGSETVEVGKHPAGITDPTKDFYTFEGWEYNSALVTLNTFEGVKDQTYNFMATWTAHYASTLDFAAITTAGTTASNPIDDFLASGNMVASNLGSKSAWETETGKSGFIGYKLKNEGAVVKFLAQPGKYVTITLGNVGDNVTLSKGGVVSTINQNAGDNVETPVDPFTTETDMIVSLTTTSGSTVTLKKIAITNTDPTAINNVETSAKAVKVLKNGMLLIEKNGKVYNAQGQAVH